MEVVRRLTLGVVVLLVAIGCTTADSPPEEMERATYEVDGRVYFVTDCPSTTNLISGGRDWVGPRPKKGLTDLERVELLLPDARTALSPNALEVNLIYRNGEVWDGPSSGDRRVETVEDYQYEVVLAPDGVCPNSPQSWHGIPLLYTRASSTEEFVDVIDFVGLTVGQARELGHETNVMVRGLQGAALADDEIIVDQVPDPGSRVLAWSIIQVDTQSPSVAPVPNRDVSAFEPLGGPGCSPPSPLLDWYADDGSGSGRLVEGLATSKEIEAWALVWERPPLRAGEKIKMVWRVTGEGEFTIRAVQGDQEAELLWAFGPRESNFYRPGEEWGTVFVFPSAGCWDIEITRATSVAHFWIEAADPTSP